MFLKFIGNKFILNLKDILMVGSSALLISKRKWYGCFMYH